MENGESTNRGRHTTLLIRPISFHFKICQSINQSITIPYSMSKLLILVVSVLVHSTSSLKITRLAGSGSGILLKTFTTIT